MAVAESVIEQVVREVSARPDANFVQQTVGAYMRQQPIAGNFVASHQTELGVEGVVLVLLHAALMARAIEASAGRAVRKLSAERLDGASQTAGDSAAFAKLEPALADYMNVVL